LTREFLSKVRARDDSYDRLAAPRRRKVYKGFADKLGAPRRWLARQVGRPWDNVHAEIFTRFDPRTLAGRHIIFDHLLQEVRIHPVDPRWFRGRPELYVDRQGILRQRAAVKRSPWRSHQLPESVREWANGRRVAAEGQALFWLEEASACETCHAWRRTPCCCPVIDGKPSHGPHVHYRQGAHLDAAEVARWRALDTAFQELLRAACRSTAR